ncbi:MAG: DUF6790 family protein [Halobacteria archaeon]
MLWITVVIGVVAGILQIYLFHTPVVKSLLLWIILFGIGVRGVISFYGLYFMPDKIADKIGFPKGNPFQREVAFANLGWGVTGLLAFFFRGNFWAAVVIGRSVFLYGAAWGHIKEYREEGNTSPKNIGPQLWFGDITVPTVLLILLVLYQFT